MKNGFFIFMFLICALLVGIFYLNTIAGMLIFLVILLMIVGYLINRKKFGSLFSPISITYLAFLLSFVIKGLYILTSNKYPEQSLILPYIYIIIFIGAMIIGFSLTSKRVLISQYNELAERNILEISSLKKRIILIVGIATALFLYKFGVSNIGMLFTNVLGNRFLFQNNGNLYFQTLILTFIQASLYIYILAIYRIEGKMKISPFLVFLFIINIFIPLTLGGRGMIFTPIVMVFFIVSSKSNKLNFFALAALAFGILIFSGWYGMFRDGITTESAKMGDFIVNVLDRYVQLDNLTRLVNNPVKFPFGKSVVDFLYSPIPRSLLPNKPYTFNSQMTQVYLPLQFQNKIVSDFTAIGELLINFGISGVFIGGVIFGKILDIFNGYFLKDTSSFFYFWYPFMMLKPMSIIYGGMINSTANMMIILELIIILLIWRFFSRGREKL
ncbi:oligosaccharide repeat unit polymerase [Enterococcus dispar]|uniref:O-antigen polymerase n=1 Tax=Enterococcus dispar TaxID=44009 RepID=UPI0021D42D9E|nr:O-antigen polymerase [Enterococcus dispar]MCU7357824.1 oligosaccharide repeat unit polymerase [Enterococcus dispar]